ncbi:hypothetical protein DSECCO2_464910 [anaerobic digester metagenome]
MRRVGGLAGLVGVAVVLDHQVVVLLGELGELGDPGVDLGGLVAKLTGVRELGPHLLILLELGLLVPDLRAQRLDLLDQFPLLVDGEDLGLLPELHVLDLLLELLDPPVLERPVLLLEALDLLEEHVRLLVEGVAHLFLGLDVLVRLVTQLLVLLRLLDELASLTVQSVPLAGELARGRVQFVPPLFVLLGLC